MKKTTAKNKRKGFGLIELTLALAIAAIVGIVVFRGYANAKDNQNVEETISQIKMLNATVQGIYASRVDYRDLRDLSFVKQLPKSMVDEEADEIKNVFGSKYEIDNISISKPDDAYRITIYNVPEMACQKLASADFGRQAKHVHVSGLAIVDDPARLSLMQAKWNCNDSTHGNTVSWIFQ